MRYLLFALLLAGCATTPDISELISESEMVDYNPEVEHVSTAGWRLWADLKDYMENAESDFGHDAEKRREVGQAICTQHLQSAFWSGFENKKEGIFTDANLKEEKE